jgi:hypothetical protein
LLLLVKSKVPARVRRSRAARRLARVLRRRLRDPVPDPSLPAPPHERRELIWTILAPHLAAQRVTVVRDDSAQGAPIAVLASELPSVCIALARAAESRPDLQVRPHRENQALNRLAASAVTVHDLRAGDWFSVGISREISDYRTGTDGFLAVLLVDWDDDRRRYLARHTRASRVDWTDLFSRAGDSQLSNRPVLIPAVIGRRPQHPCAPLDVVYTWVDSSDPAWREAHAKYSQNTKTENLSADNDERYVDRDELRYSLRSVWMFLPFVRHIFIVTADQRPAWLGDHPKISVVPHSAIFPSPEVLPTFNSHAIEACLHNIPGLSENFLYFNDDVFIGRELEEADLFTVAGLAKVRLSPSAFIYGGVPPRGAIPTDWAAYNSVGLVERDFSLTFNRRLQHVPHPLKKSVLREIEQRYPGEIERTRSARFRSTSDLAVPSMLAQYYGIATHRAVEWPHASHEYVYLNTGRLDSREKYATIMARRPKFFCLNTTRYNEIKLGVQAKQISRFMRTVFPAAAPWEVDQSVGASTVRLQKGT